MKKNEQLIKTNVAAADEKKSAEKREEYIDNLTTKLKEWNRELEKFEINNAKKLAEIRKKMDDNLAYLKTKRDKLNNKLGQVERVRKENFEEIRNDLDTLWEDLKVGLTAIKEAIKRRD
ncbi:hypothetical protein [Fodinibius saliphilus]|uniref:hypothetical protein n=1 Tax=Fodinibius saliphilus TaxID=1920650 RepID=UPI00110A010E|nr:hypothetical protein [Fodinibius saliphilus]